jgi:hypothetical protein
MLVLGNGKTQVKMVWQGEKQDGTGGEVVGF